VPVLVHPANGKEIFFYLLLVEDMVMKSLTTKANIQTIIRALVFCTLAVFVSAAQARVNYMRLTLLNSFSRNTPAACLGI